MSCKLSLVHKVGFFFGKKKCKYVECEVGGLSINILFLYVYGLIVSCAFVVRGKLLCVFTVSMFEYANGVVLDWAACFIRVNTIGNGLVWTKPNSETTT